MNKNNILNWNRGQSTYLSMVLKNIQTINNRKIAKQNDKHIRNINDYI